MAQTPVSSRRWRHPARCPALVALILGAQLIAGCSAQHQLEQRWYPLVASFFAYFQDPATDSREDEFLALFTDGGRERFLERIGGLEEFRQGSARGTLTGEKFLWPGRFQRFALGLGKILAPVEYDTEAKTALVTTLVIEEAHGLRLSRARLYRLRFAPGSTDQWLIDDVDYLREDPTVSNVQPLYVWVLVAFVAFNLVALLPAVLMIRGAPQFASKWFALWYGLALRLYFGLLNGLLNFGRSLLRRVPLAFFVLVLCPLLFLGLASLFASFAPEVYNSHVGFLLLLLAASFVLGIVMLRETGDHYLVRQRQAFGWMPSQLQVLLRPQVKFNEGAYRQVSALMVALLVVFVLLAFWPYRNKFKPRATSHAALEFTVGSEVEVIEPSPLFRLPIGQTQYVVARAETGERFPAVKRVEAEEGAFYRVVYRRRALAYLPIAAGAERVRSIGFELEGNFLNYLEELGAVDEQQTESETGDGEERILARVFVDQGRAAARTGTLQGLTRALNEYDSALDHDPTFGDTYVHRAHALASIARFLREDSLYNVFGLQGEGVPNPDKVNGLFRRALENLEAAGRLAAPVESLTAVATIVALYRGEPGEARSRLAAAKLDDASRDPYVLQARMMTARRRGSAERWAEELLRVEPDDVRALHDRGLLQLARDPALAHASFAQALRISPDFLDGRARQAVADLLLDRPAGLEQLTRLVEEEANFPYKPRFYLAHQQVNTVLLLLLPLIVGAWLYGLARLLWKPRRRQHSVRGAALRAVLLLAMLVLISWLMVPRTLPAYGLVRDWLPPVWAALGFS